jgi:uncharacterized membrane protein
VIEVHDNPDHPGFAIIEAKSNLSMSLDRLAAVFLGLSALTLLVAILPLLLGLWPILLIAIVHLLIVGWCLRLAWRGNWARERLTVGPEWLTVEHFAMRARTRDQWPVAWVRVQLETAGSCEVQVHVNCQGRRQIIGAYLPVTERYELAQTLKECLGPLTAWSAGHQTQVS